MIDRENLKYYENILSLENQKVDFINVYNIVTAINENDYTNAVDIILSNLNNDIGDIEEVKNILVPLLFAIKKKDYRTVINIVLSNLDKDTEEIKSILDSLLFAIKKKDYRTVINIVLSNLDKDTEEIKSILDSLLFAIKENDEHEFYKILFKNTSNYQLDLLENVLKTCKHNSELKNDILDSFSNNQWKSKNKLLELISMLPLPSNKSDIIIFGSWYGSILIPTLEPKAKRITCVDLDEQVLRIAKNQLFSRNDKLEFVTADIFEKKLSRYQTCDLFVNTSCEHMKPMREWPYWQNCRKDSYFAFQSNNMYDIEGHISCVDSITEFKAQLPGFFKVYHEAEIADSRGTRFCLVGKIL